MAKGKIIGGIVVGIIAIGGCNAAMNDDKGGTKAGTDSAQQAGDTNAKDADSKPKKTQAEEFTACVNKTGTATEQKAVKHVTKVTGADKQNNILDSVEVYTDYKGGLMSSHQGDAKLIATAFTSCYESDNGLVTVYGEDGKMIANANF